MEKLMTNRQLAEWVAKGKGLLKFQTLVTIDFSYDEKLEDEPIVGYLVRPFFREEWVEPTYDMYQRDFLGL